MKSTLLRGIVLQSFLFLFFTSKALCYESISKTMTTTVIMGMEAFSRLRKIRVAPVTAGVVTGPEVEIGSYLGNAPALLYVVRRPG